METDTLDLQICKSCADTGTGKYCSSCGQLYINKRISIKTLLHDVFHFFTHLEKGFGYTLKQLIVAPGTMQRLYVDGVRARHQKPFSMFFICATINGVGRYWITEILMRYYNIGNVSEASFFHQYMVLLYAVLMPLIALITWLFFYKSRYNFAEMGVLQLYQFSFIFVAVTAITMLKFIFPAMDTAYVELPVFLVYTSITFANFFNTSNRIFTVMKSILLMGLIFIIAQYIEDIMISWIGSKH